MLLLSGLGESFHGAAQRRPPVRASLPSPRGPARRLRTKQARRGPTLKTGERPGVGFLGLVEDITERQKAEAELRHSEERLSLALEAASAGMFDWNMITGEMHFSDRFYTMLGYYPGEFPATYESFESLWHPDERQAMARIIDQYRSNRTDHHEIEMRLRGKSGEWRWVASHGASFNVSVDLSLFDLVVSCGEAGLRQTSLDRLTGRAHAMGDVKMSCLDAMRRVFGWELAPPLEVPYTAVQQALGLRP